MSQTHENMATKSFKTAVCVVPPTPLWPQIQSIRATHDKSYIRWMPHINILYPFHEDTDAVFAHAAEKMAKTFKHSGFDTAFKVCATADFVCMRWFG